MARIFEAGMKEFRRVGLGAILNLLAFFAFIRLRQDSRAKGVLIATFISAFIILFLKFW